jgi:hypothetical protein
MTTEDPGTESPFFPGAAYTVRSNGSGKIEWQNLKQLALVDLDQVLKDAQENLRG